jgi:hypothetical protein
MKKILAFAVIVVFFFNCTSNKKEEVVQNNSKVSLRTDTVNVVKLTDTLVIFESTCRGCAYEASTAFAIKDSLDIVKLSVVETSDNNSPDMAGGRISKNLILVPVKTGSTILKMYKFWKGVPSNMNDSLPFTPYTIEVRNR